MANGDNNESNSPELHPSNIARISEIYESENALDTFEIELDRALEAKCMWIIIEPTKLGDETSRWILVGNYLHKTALISGLTSMVTGIALRNIPVIYIPFTIVASICSSLYTISWQMDICGSYQVETNPRQLDRLTVKSQMLIPTSATVLVRKESSIHHRYLHCGITLTAILICSFNIYRISK